MVDALGWMEAHLSFGGTGALALLPSTVISTSSEAVDLQSQFSEVLKKVGYGVGLRASLKKVLWGIGKQ